MDSKKVTLQNDPFRMLFKNSYSQEIQTQIKRVLCESILYPADTEWLAEQLEEIFSHANRTAQAPEEHAINVAVEDEQIRVASKDESVVLEWRAFWQERGKSNRSVDLLSQVLCQWRIFQGS